jgi:hypothetical protein
MLPIIIHLIPIAPLVSKLENKHFLFFYISLNLHFPCLISAEIQILKRRVQDDEQSGGMCCRRIPCQLSPTCQYISIENCPLPYHRRFKVSDSSPQQSPSPSQNFHGTGTNSCVAPSCKNPTFLIIRFMSYYLCKNNPVWVSIFLVSMQKNCWSETVVSQRPRQDTQVTNDTSIWPLVISLSAAIPYTST